MWPNDLSGVVTQRRVVCSFAHESDQFRGRILKRTQSTKDGIDLGCVDHVGLTKIKLHSPNSADLLYYLLRRYICEHSEWKAQHYLQTLSTWPPGIQENPITQEVAPRCVPRKLIRLSGLQLVPINLETLEIFVNIHYLSSYLCFFTSLPWSNTSLCIPTFTTLPHLFVHNSFL